MPRPTVPFPASPNTPYSATAAAANGLACTCPYRRKSSGGAPGRTVPLLNVKCRPEHIGAMRAQAGILPAYHMSKEHWLSIELEQADDALTRQLIDDSFHLTQGKAKIRKQAT